MNRNPPLTISRRPEQPHYPLSSAQRRLWVLSQLEEGSIAYNSTIAFEVEGPLDIDVLRRALSATVDRHESMRTVFVDVDGMPRQQVLPVGTAVPFRVVDLRAMHEGERDAYARSLVREDEATPFDLATGPLTRVTVMRASELRSILVFTTHHIVSDGWSAQVFAKDLGASYVAFAQLQPNPLLPLPIQYKDYACWQLEQLETEAYQKAKEYWLATLGGGIPTLELHTDRPRPPLQTFDGRTSSFVWPKELLADIKRACRAENATLYVYLVTLVKVLLHRYTDQEDIVVGAVAAGRTHAELWDQIGYYVNTFALRTRLSADESFSDVLRRVRKTTLQAMKHSAYPLDELVEHLALKRDLSRSTLFDVMVILQNTPSAVMQAGPLAFKPFPFPRVASQFDMTFEFEEFEDGIRLNLEYNTDLFDPARIEGFGEHLLALARDTLARPHGVVKELALLSPERRQKILGFNSKTAPVDTDRGVHHIFEDWARREPERTIFISARTGQKATYAEVNARANRLARLFLAEGIGPDVPVLVALDRDPEMVATILALWKIGAFYIPLLLREPSARLRAVVEESGAQHLVCRVEEQAAEIRLPATKVIGLQEREAEISNYEASDLRHPYLESRVAYTMFTSGSTGRPKGAMIEHRGMMNHLHMKIAELDITRDSVVSQDASQTFDISVWQYFAASMVGGVSVFFDRDHVLQPEELARELGRHDVTILEVVPSYLAVLLETYRGQDLWLGGLELLLVSGEALPVHLVKRWFECLPDVRLVNAYGITETSDDFTHHAMDRAPEGAVSIGGPSQNVHVYVVDRHMQPRPIGWPGEICVAGVAVGRGYLNDETRTAAVFGTSPFEDSRGQRLYRTGDLGSWRPDGTLDFFGRRDHQVKIRGFRIELGEIEEHITQHALVKEACVLDRNDAHGEKQLCAYVVAKPGFDADALKGHLAERLPSHMVPLHVVELAAIPLTPNTKVDRKALLAIPLTPVERKVQEPATPTEQGLYAVWREVIGDEVRFGTEESFFELGGNSLSATRLAGKVHKALGVRIPLIEIFKRPSIAGLAAYIDENERTRLDGIPRAPERSEYPLSFAQRRLWVLSQLEEGSIAYNTTMALELLGALDGQAVERALDTMIERHESLRTVFSDIGGVPRQRILPKDHSGIALRTVDVRGEGNPDAEALRWVEREEARPFDLMTGPLVRPTLIRLGAERHVFAMTTHHIIGDGWSEQVFARELVVLYEAYAHGRDNPLEPLGLQYRDYALWQTETQNRTNEFATAESYWRTKLSGDLPTLELPTDRPRPPIQTFHGATHEVHWSGALGERLEAVCRRDGVTLYMLLVAAVKVLLHRYTGQEDLIVGMPTAGRTHRDLEGQIGFYVSTLALRTHVAGDDRFEDVLGRVKVSVLEGMENAIYPFDLLVEKLAVKRDLSRSAIFDVMVILQNHDTVLGAEPTAVNGLSFKAFPYRKSSIQFDLVVEFEQHPHSLLLRIGYNTDLFDADRIERMAGHLETLLRYVSDRPAARVKALDILPASERVALASYNPVAPVDEAASIPGRFEAQVRATPDAIALVHGAEQIRYEQLNRRANRLAHELRALGVGPDVVVGIHAERSPRMVVALLGILKAGGAYLPLDPNYPKARLAYMLSHSGISVLLTERHLAERVPEHQAQVIHLDEALPPGDEGDLPHFSHAEMLGYVMYTSGSTGQPKGVAMRTGALVNLVDWQMALSNARAGTRTLQFPSFSFDVSFQDTLSTLYTGGTLVLSSDEQRMDAEQLLELLAAERIERVFMPVVMLHQLAHRAVVEGRQGLPLREIYIGGETLRINDDVRAFLKSLPGCRLFNHYGPTETHVTTSWESPPSVGDIPDLPPIGAPAANVTGYVLDSDLRQVPIGIPGEVYHGGAQVARGYYRDPARTAERFIPDPFGPPGSRMYQTGDVARWQKGELRFLGREDGQIKIRGYRVELGEIEAALRRLPSVREVVVLAFGDTPASKRLVAYVQAEREMPSAAELHDALANDLPEYMLPALYIGMEAWPLTPSGKLHRKGLLPPSELADRILTKPAESSSREAEEPRTPVEKLVADTFSEVLGSAHVDRDGHFFLLGGHSLLATQVVSRLRTALGVHLPVRVLFEAPTVRALAERIRAAGGEWRIGAPPLARASRGEHAPLSFAQQRLWFMDQLEPRSTAYNIGFGVRLEGELNAEALRQAFEDLVDRHEVLRTTFSRHSGEAVQRIHDAGRWELPMADLTGADEPEQQVRRLALAAVNEPFDLARGPLFRTTLLRFGPCDHVLVGVMHHIVSDGWSMDILLREVAAHYEARMLGGRAELPALPVQVADHAIWQRDWLKGIVLQKQIAYWKDRLAGLVPLVLPTDRPRSAVSERAGALVPVVIPAPIADGLRALARREGATLFMVLLAAFQVVLGRWSGRTDVAVGAAIAGRTQRELESLIGFFVNTLVLRSDFSDNPSFTTLLRRVKDDALGAFAHQDVPFEKLVEELSPSRELGQTPFFQVMFAMQNAPSAPLRLAGVTFRNVDIDQGAEKFDMTLELAEDDAVVRGGLHYQPALFEPATIERLVQRFVAVLEAVVRAPSMPVGRLPMTTPDEQALLARYNDTAVRYPDGVRLMDSFEQQAMRVPGRTAVTDAAGELTYEELHRRANRLAHYLRARGVGPDVSVGIAFERCIEQVVAVFAVLKAGGAYVPMDPSHPPERLARMMAETGMHVVLSPATLREVGEEWPDTNPERVGGTDNLAYVLYTSGSTGAPKGVMVTERGLLNYLSWALGHYGAGGDGAPVHSPLTFDLTVTSLLTPLLSGTRLVLCEEQAGGTGLARSLTAKSDFNLVKLTPAHLTMLEHELPPEAAGAARVMVIGGEALTAEHLAFFRQHAPKTRWINEYGPTETVVGCCVYEVTEADPSSGPIPIGRPIANTQLHVLDESMLPVPFGVAGELYVGGAGVARGYIAQAAWTAERFVPDPFSGVAGARLYRTGDLVRHRFDGNLVFLGRVDHQVKIRGHRIELEEIDAVLSGAPGVAECAVIAVLRGAEAELVAFVRAENGADVAPSALAHLREHLPRYMVPSTVVVRDALPLTPNGKIDRRALAASPPPARGPAQPHATDAPRTALQQRLAAAFEEVLRISHVGVHDDFFALGGHSLLAVRLASRVEDLLGQRIPLSQVFRTPTIASLAATLEQGVDSVRSAVLPFRTTGSEPPTFFVHALGGSAMAYRDLAAALGDEHPCYGLQAAGVDGDEPPRTTVESLAEHAIAALRRIRPEGPYRLGGWSFGGVIAREMAQRLTEAGERIESLALIDTWAPGFSGGVEDEFSLLLGLARELDLAVEPSRLAGLSGRDRLSLLAERAASAGLFSAHAAERTLGRLLRVVTVHAEALRHYTPRTYSGPMTLIRAREAYDAESETRIARDPTCGWGARTSSHSIDVHVVDGNHDTILRRPHVEAIASVLRCRP